MKGVSYKTRYLVACDLGCSAANLLYDAGLSREAEDAVEDHEKCVLCRILIGPDHYSTGVVDGKCKTCEPRVLA